MNLHIYFHKLIVFKTLCNYLQFRDQINTTWVMQKKRGIDTENFQIHALISLINDLVIITGYV